MLLAKCRCVKEFDVGNVPAVAELFDGDGLGEEIRAIAFDGDAVGAAVGGGGPRFAGVGLDHVVVDDANVVDVAAVAVELGDLHESLGVEIGDLLGDSV